MKKDLHIEPESTWATPENLCRLARDGEHHYASYAAFAAGDDDSDIEFYAIVDDDYASEYARNLLLHLGRRGLATSGRLVDVGCAVGTITGALKRELRGNYDVAGIELSEAAVGAARDRFPECAFTVESADELDSFPDGSLNLIHAREFYPFSRSASVEFHISFLETFARKLAPGGLVVIVQIVEKRGMAYSFPSLGSRMGAVGLTQCFRDVVVPLRLFRRLGAAAHSWAVYPAVTLAGHAMEAFRPGKVSFLYGFRKDPA